MYSQRNRNRPDVARMIGVILFIGLIVYMATKDDKKPAANPAPTPVPPRSSVVPATPAVPRAPAPVARARDVDNLPLMNPIERLLLPRDSAELIDGVGAAILVDTSGSMKESVADVGGKKSPKIEIARRAVMKLIGQTADFAKAHPEQNVQLGIFEFSARNRQPNCRQVVPLSAPDAARADAAVQNMVPEGGTPIGDAIIFAKQKLNETRLRKLHILVVTDGINNNGHKPADVVSAMTRLDEQYRAPVYFIAFDVAAGKFAAVRDAGGLVLAASNESELQQTLDYVLTGKILAEQPPATGGK